MFVTTPDHVPCDGLGGSHCATSPCGGGGALFTLSRLSYRLEMKSSTAAAVSDYLNDGQEIKAAS